MIRSYRDLIVWQLGMDLVVETYRLTTMLPKTETYGLKSQMQRAAVSVVANIAEGHGRDHRGDYLRMLSIAKGSLTEHETLLTVTERIGMLTSDVTRDAWLLCDREGRLLRKLSQSLQQSTRPTRRQ
jgi:four helix bundle protein